MARSANSILRDSQYGPAEIAIKARIPEKVGARVHIFIWSMPKHHGFQNGVIPEGKHIYVYTYIWPVLVHKSILWRAKGVADVVYLRIYIYI